MNENYFKYTPSVILFPLLFTGFLWLVFFVEDWFNFDLHFLAILPRSVQGLPGIFTSAFLHGSLSHIANNSVPLFVLMAALIYFYREVSLKVVFLGILFSGAFTWIFGRQDYHLGASGLIYVLFSFIFFKGIFTKYYRLVALSLAVILSYGGMIWYVFPGVEEQISWEGHLGGFLAGLVFAFVFKTPEYKEMLKYDWQKPDFNPKEDAFMKRFDENGNFVNPPPPEPEILDDEPVSTDPFRVIYTFVPKAKEDSET
ncbi:rhomboid family intramembrane serine protease [Flavobacterium silvaticum]|uniref:Rhomboid family intramembrane serine protease n=1 Tax=Flavobacterium silvaticum TaxID=1852020 RepID=A0A972FUK7_9FLAO|nr:rhomboid family intramembrane serine protease [Flavobacterium silvaticum]NMH29599.1 rhomboid family intramembrane serine protease [Flavobacterium silvaticum]